MCPKAGENNSNQIKMYNDTTTITTTAIKNGVSNAPSQRRGARSAPAESTLKGPRQHFLISE